MNVSTRRLVGRDRELERLERLVDGLSEGEGAIVEIVGEPGIGKTSLVSWICERAGERHLVALRGAAFELEEELPFALVLDTLDDYLAAIEPARLGALEEHEIGELKRVFPGLGMAGGADDPVASSDQRQRANEAVRRLLEELAGWGPLVFALDDLQWADDASIALSSHLVRRPPRAPVLLVLSYRSTRAPRRLRAAIERIAADANVARLELRPLSAADAEDMVPPAITGGLRERVLRQAGGNPFYLDQLARERPAEAATPLPELEIDVPDAVRDALARELEQLGETCRLIANAATVAGEPFEPTLVGRIAELDEPNVLGGFDTLCSLDLIRPTDVPRYFAFRHPIVRRAVYGLLPQGWRLAAHGRAAAALAADSSPAVVLAHHLERSAAPGDRRAMEVIVEAARTAVPRAPATAAHYFESALRLLEPTATDERLGLLVERARALASIGELGNARSCLREAIDLIPPDLSAVLAPIVAACARIDALRGEHELARSTLAVALENLEDDGSREAGELRHELAGSAFYTGDFEAMYFDAEVAMQCAERHGDRTFRAAAATTLAGAEYMVGRMDAARSSVDRAAATIDAMPDEEIAIRPGSIMWLGWSESYLERYEDALRHIERGLRITADAGQGYPSALLHLPKAWVLLWRGRLEDADGAIEAAIETSQLTQADVFLAWALALRSSAALLRGDVHSALDAATEGVESAGTVRDVLRVLPHLHLAEALVEAGEAERGRDALIDAVGGPELPLVERGFRSHWYELLTRAELVLGRLDAAESWAAAAEGTADGLGIQGRSAEALRAQAAVELARGDPTGAARFATESAAAAERAGNEIDIGRARLIAGRALAAAGKVEDAIAALTGAERKLDACGAKRLRDEAAAELRQTGATVAPRGRRAVGDAGIEALSGREREVVELLTRGHTNREIGAMLFLSEKTISTHLGRIFRKLEVTSRAEAAAIFERARARETA